MKKNILLINLSREMNSAGIKTADKIHVTLYTARHQFSANMKNILSKDQVADLMGHSSNETAGLHYGKKRSGHLAYKEANKEMIDLINSSDNKKSNQFRLRP